MGKRKRLLLEYQPTAGVNADFEQLLQRFTATETVRFEHFAEIWRNMKMSFMYAGRDSERECREFTEDIMKMALKYMLPPYNFQVRVGGLYLLYGLYYQQPLVRKARVRVTPSIWKEIVEFQSEARNQQHLDVNYIFHKLRADDVFIFSATETEVFFNLTPGIYTSHSDTGPDEFKDEQTVLYDLFSDQFLQQLTQLHDHYHNVKVGLEGPDAKEPSRSLNVIQTNLVPSLYSTVMAYHQKKKTINVKKESDSDLPDPDDEDYKPGGKSIQSSLKAKAFRNVAKAHRSRRHRQAVDSADDSSPQKPKRGKKRRIGGWPPGSPKKKKGGKKSVKVENDLEEHTEESDEPEQSHDQVEACPGTAEEVDEGEAIYKEILSMPLFDDETLSSNKQNKTGKKKNSKQKGKVKDKNSETKKSEETKENKNETEKSVPEQDTLNLEKNEVNEKQIQKKKGTKKQSKTDVDLNEEAKEDKEDKNETEKSVPEQDTLNQEKNEVNEKQIKKKKGTKKQSKTDVDLNEEAKESNTQKSEKATPESNTQSQKATPEKKSLRKQKDKNFKSKKGKMPSIRLSPLKKKTKEKKIKQEDT